MCSYTLANYDLKFSMLGFSAAIFGYQYYAGNLTKNHGTYILIYQQHLTTFSNHYYNNFFR